MTREIGIEVRQIGRDPDAFAAFYKAHVQVVQGFVARRVSDPHLAADLTADVFVAAIDSADRYRPERGVPEAWLMGVARNVVNAEFRRATKHRAVTRRICARELLDTTVGGFDGLPLLVGRAVGRCGDLRRRWRRNRVDDRFCCRLSVLGGRGDGEAVRAEVQAEGQSRRSYR